MIHGCEADAMEQARARAATDNVVEGRAWTRREEGEGEAEVVVRGLLAGEPRRTRQGWDDTAGREARRARRRRAREKRRGDAARGRGDEAARGGVSAARGRG